MVAEIVNRMKANGFIARPYVVIYLRFLKVSHQVVPSLSHLLSSKLPSFQLARVFVVVSSSEHHTLQASI